MHSNHFVHFFWNAKKFVHFLKSDSHFLEKNCYLLGWKRFKNDEKCFLFDLKSSFRSQDIYVFVTTFWSYKKNSLIIKESAKSRGLLGNVGYVGCLGAWVTWVKFFRGLRGSLRGSKFFTWVQNFCVGQFFLLWSAFVY